MFDSSYKDILFPVTPCQQEGIEIHQIQQDSTGPMMKMMESASRPCKRKLHLWAALGGTIDGHFEENGCGKRNENVIRGKRNENDCKYKPTM